MTAFARIALLIGLACASACSSEKPVVDGRGTPAPVTRLRFVDRTPVSGVAYAHEPTYTEDKWMPEVLGAGVAIADFNRDGAPDIVFANSGKFGETRRPANAANRLYLNDGRGKFADRTAEWNLTGVGYGQGVAVGDFDNDGFTDLFLTSFEGDNRLLRNTGERFEDVTARSGIRPDDKWATSAGFADFDGDGDLDLFVVRYVAYTKENHQDTYRNGLETYSAPFLYDGVADQLLRNDGNGRFTDVSATAGISESPQKGLALAVADIDRDGDVDVYVANDTTPNQLWLNDGSGKFKDVARLAGCAYSDFGKEEGSMGVDVSDVDSNERLEIVVTNFQQESTALYEQMQPMFFREISAAAGIGRTARQRLSFGVEFFDADNDGDEDLLVANGHIEDNIEQNSDSVSFAQQNTLYENAGDGKFTDVSDGAGDALQDRKVSRGIVVTDLNGDGRLDFVVANNGGAAQVAFNETLDGGSFVGLWLEGTSSNRSAIGARVVARVGDRRIERQVIGAQSYLSVSDFRVHIGLGTAQQIDELTVHWPDGARQVVPALQSGKWYYLEQNDSPRPFTPGLGL